MTGVGGRLLGMHVCRAEESALERDSHVAAFWWMRGPRGVSEWC